ncbi:MAG TPA: hypothetical protein VNV65_09170 [Candidatus Solibacter sp.]|jgi:hypothetical protein|nr:hypothetical protein [Candidatus Solibacter sp.]
MPEVEPRLPDNARLRDLVGLAAEELAVAAPLGAAILSGRSTGLPDGGIVAHQRESQQLAETAAELDTLDGLDGDDELDRLALAHALHRVSRAATPRPPGGALLVERHLLAALLDLAAAPEPRAEELAALVESAPGFLEASRQGCEGAAAVSGEVALAAAKRLPLLLDLSAAAARSLPISPPLRQRLEAGLGELLTAAAEDSGWLLKEYMPAAGLALPSLTAEPSGLGLSLDDVEAAAEAMLADQAGLDFDDLGAQRGEPPEGPPAFPPGALPREPAGLAVVADACRRVEAACDPWCPDPGDADFVVEAQPAWLQPLLPPLALAAGGPLGGAPIRLLVGDGVAGISLRDLEHELAVIHAAEYLPAAADRRHRRLARLLMPSPESREGWRALALAGAPGIVRRHRREIAWRAILALVALGMGRGRLEIGEAANLIAAETGMDGETARLQAVHVAAQPAAALTFIAGAAAVGAAVDRIARGHGDPTGSDVQASARARVLLAGGLPGVAINRLGYTP